MNKYTKISLTIPLSVIVLILMLLLGVWGFGDITQYKRIGDTNFFLVETMAESLEGRPLPDLYYSRNAGKDGFSGVNQRGIPYQIFWNGHFLVVKCSDRDSKRTINYCIIEFSDSPISNRTGNYDLHEYAGKREYEKAMLFFGLKESEMNQTDSRIPWSIHLWD